MTTTYHPYEGSPEYEKVDLSIFDKSRLQALAILMAGAAIMGAFSLAESRQDPHPVSPQTSLEQDQH